MNKQSKKRLASLLPNGTPKYVRIYDNGGTSNGGSMDRYTVVYTGKYRTLGLKRGEHLQSWFQYVSMNSAPFHPQGIGMHGENQTQIDTNKSGFAPAMGRKNHLGIRIAFADLPPNCQKLVLQDYRELWDLPSPLAGLTVKLHPARFTAMSPRMASIVAYIIGEEWVNPQINGLTITSDGFVLASMKGDCGYNHFIGAKSDLQDNWKHLLHAVTDLAPDERQLAEKLFADKIKTI